MDQRMLDTLAIKEVVENWAVFRDSGDWERFRSVWHEEGVMMATWFQGSFEEFIRVNKEGWVHAGREHSALVGRGPRWRLRERAPLRRRR